MSVSQHSERSQRGRCLIVGHHPALQNLLQQSRPSQRSCVQVSNVFEALGEITVAGAAGPITTVAMIAGALPGSLMRAAESIRTVDPAIRIVMLTTGSSKSEAEHAVGSGFDEQISIADAQAISTLLNIEIAASADKPVELEKMLHPMERDLQVCLQTAEPAAAKAHTHVQGGCDAVLVHELHDEPEAAHTPGPADQARPSMRAGTKLQEAIIQPVPVQPVPVQPQSSHASASSLASSTAAAAPSRMMSAATPLGDIDLVQAILNGRGELLSLALQLIQQQTKWQIEFAAGENATATNASADVAPAASSVEARVVHEHVTYGRLRGQAVAVEDLQQWADWLAHWLALDAAFAAHRRASLEDDLTGAGNRRFFQMFLKEAIERAAKARQPVTLMVFDIDNFKSYNDQFGHAAGDEILCETVRLMHSVIRQGDRVCRIGGDEFAVIFADEEGPRAPGSKHPASVEEIATRFQDQICKMRFPKLGAEAPGTLSISAGLATYPWDGIDPEALLRHADQLALESKRKGKNAITFGPGARSVCAAWGSAQPDDR